MHITRFLLVAALLFCAVDIASAANIPIVNPSFEADVLTCTPDTAGCSTDNSITGWTGSTTVNAIYGVYPLGTASYPGGAPNGVNAAFLLELGAPESISQTLTTVLKANDTYTLSFYVGLRADTNQYGGLGCYGFNASLLAGGNVLNTLILSDGNASCTLVKVGSFTKLSFTYTSGSNPAGLGSPLQIVLTAQGSGSTAEPAEIDFDEIVLTDTGGASQTYYFSDLAFSGGYQTTLTYVNYSPLAVTCTTNFYSDAGSPLAIPFTQGAVTSRVDTMQPGGSVHDATIASLAPPFVEGWAAATCNGPVQAGLLYRYFVSGAAIGEASVNAEIAGTTAFATFAQTATGIAYANLSTTQSATVTVEVYSTAGSLLGSHVLTLGPLAHSSANVGPLVGLTSFTGFVKITSTVPIISLSLNAEAFPVFSSLPPGDLPNGTAVVP